MNKTWEKDKIVGIGFRRGGVVGVAQMWVWTCGRRIFEEGEESYCCEFTFFEEDELGDAHLEIACCNQACPEYRHDVSVASLNIAIHEGEYGQKVGANMGFG